METTMMGLGFRRNGKLDKGLWRDCYKDPFLHSKKIKGKAGACGGRVFSNRCREYNGFPGFRVWGLGSN